MCLEVVIEDQVKDTKSAQEQLKKSAFQHVLTPSLIKAR